MKREVFLSIVFPLAILIGLVALLLPSVLLESKGVIPESAVKVWMSEVGLLLIANGIILFLVRKDPVSNSLKAIFVGNMIIQLGLLIIEVRAFERLVIKDIMGIIPNSVLHVILSIGFLYFLIQMHREQRAVKHSDGTINPKHSSFL